MSEVIQFYGIDRSRFLNFYDFNDYNHLINIKLFVDSVKRCFKRKTVSRRSQSQDVLTLSSMKTKKIRSKKQNPFWVVT